jgi:Flp pilus assembly protein TadG
VTALRRATQTLARRVRPVGARRDMGSTTAEMALLTPLLVMILLFVVLCGRLVAVQIDVDAAASAAARAASIARTRDAAQRNAEQAARATLAARRVACSNPSVAISGSLAPGGAVTAQVTCRVGLHDLALLAVPGSRDVTSKATSPIDQWRAGSR